MKVSALRSAALIPIFVIACGGEPPPPAEAPAPVAKPAPKPEPVDIGAVPEPRSLVLQARIAHPADSVRVLAGWLGMPAPSTALVGEAVSDMEIGDVLDLAQPLDVALTVEGSGRPEVGWAIAAALAPGADARLREAFTVSPGPGGVLRLEPRKDADDTDRRCAGYPAYPSGMRLVCSESEKSLRELGPYLARTRTRVPAGKDVELEARGAPVRDLLTAGRQLFPALASSLIGRKKGGVNFGAVLQDVVGDVIDFGLDLQTIKLEATLNDAGADATLRVALSGNASMIGRFMTSHPEKAGPPPDTFARLPADSESATYGRGFDPDDITRPKEVILRFVHSVAEMEQPLAAPDKEVLDRAIAGYMDLGTNGWVSASGSDWAQIAAAAKKLDDAKHAPKPSVDATIEAERLALEKMGGWSLWGVEAPLAKVQPEVKDVVAALNRPFVQKALKGVMKDGVPAPTLKIVPVSAALKLPKDSMHVELTVTRAIDENALASLAPAPAATAKPKPKPNAGTRDATKGDTLMGPVAKVAPKAGKPRLAKPIKLHYFVVPEGARTWIAWGFDEAQVAGRVRAVVAGEGATLATRRGLEPIQSGKWSSGGFMTPRSLARSDAGITALIESAGNLRLPPADKLASSDFGTAPFFIGMRAEAADGLRAGVLSFDVPAAAIRDLGAVGLGKRRRP